MVRRCFVFSCHQPEFHLSFAFEFSCYFIAICLRIYLARTRISHFWSRKAYVFKYQSCSDSACTLSMARCVYRTSSVDRYSFLLESSMQLPHSSQDKKSIHCHRSSACFDSTVNVHSCNVMRFSGSTQCMPDRV